MLGVENYCVQHHGLGMLNTRALLDRLKASGARNVDIAKALSLPTSRIPEIYSGKRALKLDEGVALIERFDLGDEPQLDPLSLPVARLLALYVADSFGLRLDPADDRVEEVARDVTAFAKFAADPHVRNNEDRLGGMLDGVRLARGPKA